MQVFGSITQRVICLCGRATDTTTEPHAEKLAVNNWQTSAKALAVSNIIKLQASNAHFPTKQIPWCVPDGYPI